MIAQEKAVTDKARAAIQRRTATVIAHKVSTTIPATDSLDYYIDKIERELAQVDESLYIERMNKVIRADERLQRIVNSYILHTLDKEGRPQTADNMYNVKTEEDEEYTFYCHRGIADCYCMQRTDVPLQQHQGKTECFRGIERVRRASTRFLKRRTECLSVCPAVCHR